MRIRPLLLPATFISTSLLAGCALQPSPDDERPAPLDPQRFEQRINTLEQNLLSRCELGELSLQDQNAKLHTMHRDVREVGSLVRHLRADVEQITEAPQIITTQCRQEDNDALQNKELLGNSEWIGLPDVGTYLKARIDTGANTSSLSAKEITRFERDGENWVRFKLALDENDVVVDPVRDQWIEAPIQRRVRIVQAAGDESRPVVSLLMTLGPIRESVEFTLTDRSHMSFPVLLGRRFVMDIAIIDVSQRYIHPRPEFPGGAPSEQADRDQASDETDETVETEQ